MNVFASLLIVLYLFPFETYAQFRILGLLNVNDSKPKGSSSSFNEFQSSARGRGFSVDEGLKKFLIRPKNIIRVHVIGNVDESEFIPEIDKILMIQTIKPTVRRPANSIRTETLLKKPPTTGKNFKRLFACCVV